MDTKLLKQKILDLAIHGKLVPQNPSDEPASKLLEKIREEKQKLIAEKKIKADKNDSYIFVGDDNRHYEKFADGTVKDIEDEIPFEVPEGWAWCRLGILSETTDYIANGSFADTRENVHFYKEENYALLVKTQDFNNNFTDDLTFTDKQGYDFLSKSHLFGGELLLSNIGASIGKALIVPYLNRPMAVAPNSIIVRTKDLLNTEYLRFMMLSSYGQKSLMDFTSGSAMPKFNKTQLRSLLVALPSPKVQKNILEAIKNIFDKIDSLETDKAALQTSIKQAKSKILDLAIHGKLVPQDSSEEPASKFLERLRAEKEAKIKAGELKRDKNDSFIYKNTTDNCYYQKFVDGSEVDISDELYFNLPSGWCYARYNSFVTFTGGSQPPKETFEYKKTDDNIRLIQIRDYKTDKFITYIPKSKARRFCSKDDIMIGRYGPPLFQILRGIEGAYNVALMKAECDQRLMDREYLYYLLQERRLLLLLESISDRTCGQDGVNVNVLENYIIGIPPLAEQKRIVEKIENAFAKLDQIAEQLA